MEDAGSQLCPQKPVPALSQKIPVHTLRPYLFNMHFIFILLSMLRSSKSSLPFRISDQNFVPISDLSHTCYQLLSPHPRFPAQTRHTSPLLVRGVELRLFHASSLHRDNFSFHIRSLRPFVYSTLREAMCPKRPKFQ